MRSSIAFALLALCGNAFGVRLAIPEVRDLGLAQREPKPELDKRITCIEDDYLLSLQMYSEDSYPSCSAYLGIPETTTIAAETARTTVIVLQTTFQTFQKHITIPAGTTTVTTTVPNTLAGPTFKKRQDDITPAAVLFSQCAEATGLNASLIRSVSSACSCLFITEKVNVVTTTSTLTRIEPGIDYQQTTVVDTTTGPETTVYYTVKPTTFGPNPNTTTSTTASLPSSSPPSSGPLVPTTTGLTTAPTASSSVPAPSSNGTSVLLPPLTTSSRLQGSVSTPIGTSLSSSPTGPIGNPSISGGGRGESDSSTTSTTPTGGPSVPGVGNSTTIPIHTGSISSLRPSSSANSVPISSSGVPSASSVQPPPLSIPVGNSSTPIGASTGVPTPPSYSLSTTTLTRSTTAVVGPSTSIPSASGNTSITSSSLGGSPTIPTGSRGGPSVTLPSASGNASITSSTLGGSPTIPTGSRGGSSVTPSGSAFSGITPSGPISSIIVPSRNSTFPPGPTGTNTPPIASECPAVNGTIYTAQCQNFLIECDINYGGPVDQGLVERTLYGCVDDCAIANVGFSQSRCYAASYFPNVIGPNCFFKTQQDSLTPLDNEKTISALLLNPSYGNSSIQGCPFPPGSGNSTTKPAPTATGGSVTLSSKAATTNITSIKILSHSSAPASSSKFSSRGNGTSTLPIATAPLSSGTVPTASYSRHFSGTVPTASYTQYPSGTVPTASFTRRSSSGTIPTLPAGNSTTTTPSGHKSGSVPPFSISLPSQSRFENQSLSSTAPATSCPSTKCTSYVYSTSVLYITSIISAI